MGLPGIVTHRAETACAGLVAPAIEPVRQKPPCSWECDWHKNLMVVQHNNLTSAQHDTLREA
jgi:hypothetical protein